MSNFLSLQGKQTEEGIFFNRLLMMPRAWYQTLSNFLEDAKFVRGITDPTIVVRKTDKHLMLVQIYVDDIIFASTDEAMCDEFAGLMKSKFEMSMMGEMSNFLGLQVKQEEEGIFFNQERYVLDLLKKYSLENCSHAKIPMGFGHKMDADLLGEAVDQKAYRSMIGSLLYLTPSRPDSIFSTCLCARHQANPKKSQLLDVKQIFRYFRGTVSLGIWYPAPSGFTWKRIRMQIMGAANWIERVLLLVVNY